MLAMDDSESSDNSILTEKIPELKTPSIPGITVDREFFGYSLRFYPPLFVSGIAGFIYAIIKPSKPQQKNLS